MTQSVEISFDCLPLRSLPRVDVPIDASPKYRLRCERIKHAIDTYGAHNAYFLYNAKCNFHLTNRPDFGLIEFRFEGTVLTDPDDQQTVEAHLHVELARETCDWLTEPIVRWFYETVTHSVKVEFDRYIAAGDLEQAHRRAAEIQARADEHGGYVGMYL